MENSIRVMYIRDRENNPYGCIAMAREVGEESSVIKFALSVVHSKNDVFDKKIGRQIAKGRLIDNPEIIHTDETVDFRWSTHDITAQVMQSIVEAPYGHFPCDAVKFAKRWLAESLIIAESSNSYFLCV
jgi:hypothetical protein